MPSKQTLTIYCHGLPGSAEEIKFLVPSGNILPIVLGPQDGIKFDKFLTDNPSDNIHLIGFSLGAMSAIKLAARHPERIDRLTLISPAAPLELGDFLPKMAGKPVFRMAMKGSMVFRIFTALQNLGFTLASNIIIQSMFQNSPQADKELLSDPVFMTGLRAGLKSSLGKNSADYRTAVQAYVTPWAHILKQIKCPVTIYHGEEDDWAPVEMSLALKTELSSRTDISAFKKLGHFSTLHKALPKIMKH